MEKMPKEWKDINGFSQEAWEEIKNTLISHVKKMVEINECLKNIYVELCPQIFEKEDAVDNYSPLYGFKLYKSFDAFLTLTLDDILFLAYFMKASDVSKGKIMERMNIFDHRTGNDVINFWASKENGQWLAVRKRYASSKNKPENDDYWAEFCRKVKALARNSTLGPDGGRNQPLVLYFFLNLIWPKEDDIDTSFGPKEIDSLIHFKYLLTENAQRKLLDELKNW